MQGSQVLNRVQSEILSAAAAGGGDSKHYWPLTIIFGNNTASKGYWPEAILFPELLNVANVQKHNYIFMWHSVQCLKYSLSVASSRPMR